MASSTIQSLLIVAGLCASPVYGNLFLARLGEAELKQVLLGEIEAALGSNLGDVTKRRLNGIEEELRPTFEVLPKEGGKLDHDGVRYLLKRVFAEQHRWVINGFQPGAVPWNSSVTKDEAMKDHIPEVMQELFEKRVGGGGAGLQDVVVLAATIEHLIRDELRGKLEAVYQAKQVLWDDVVDGDTAVNLMEVYMICFMRGQQSCAWRSGELERLEQTFHVLYPSWGEVKQLIKETHQAIAQNADSFSFDSVAITLEKVVDRWAVFYQTWCGDMKDNLLSMEEGQRSGRVRLADFYKAALHKGHSFFETVEVLRRGGSLDETAPANPRVIIPNYVVGVSNCVAGTSFYSTCCLDPCETLLSQVERALGKSDATAAELVSTFEAQEPVSLVLSPWLTQRLDDLARHHAGTIPLHGRLFAQWMHFAHPRDCTYPRLPNTTYKKSLAELRGDDHSATLTRLELEDVATHFSDLASETGESADGPDHTLRMWTMEEELFVDRSKLGSRPLWSALRFVAVAMAILVAASMLLPSMRNTKTGSTSYKASISKFV